MKLRPILGRAPHAERRVGRPGIVILDSLRQLQEHGFRIPQVRARDVIALQGFHDSAIPLLCGL